MVVRELKAVGVELKVRKPKKHKTHIDYNAEIPYEKKPVPGLYATTEKLSHKGTGAESLKGKFLDSLEAKSRVGPKDAAGFAHPSDQKAMDAIAAKEEAEQLAKRKKLVLPLPQVSNSELETTAKLGQQGALSKELVGGTDGGALSDTLLGNYSETPSTTVARASRTPAQLDCLTNKGFAHYAGYVSSWRRINTETSGAMPHGDSAATPNPFATSFRPSAQGGASGANGSGKDPSAVRDELGLNTSAQEIGATPRERKVDQSWIAQAK
ncbi:Pre-mRNA-splicing factor cef1 [Coemansia sp. RSA 1813]|nr:Pre-mRNA-splicing factor cef1 [Coemansia sp. RSA 1813]